METSTISSVTPANLATPNLSDMTLQEYQAQVADEIFEVQDLIHTGTLKGDELGDAIELAHFEENTLSYITEAIDGGESTLTGPQWEEIILNYIPASQSLAGSGFGELSDLAGSFNDTCVNLNFDYN